MQPPVEPPIDPSALVLASTSYIDSIEVQQLSYFRSGFLKYMEKHCGSTYGPEEFLTYGRRTKNRIWLHQPESEAIGYLRDKAGIIAEVHVALDLLCATPADANAVQRYLETRLVPSMQPYDRVEFFDTTIYYGFTRPRRIGKRITAYSDFSSKTQRGACCHVELRFKGAAGLRKAGLRTADDILALDYTEFWSRQVRLVSTPTVPLLGARYASAFIKNKLRRSAIFPYGGRTAALHRVGHLLLRSAQGADGTPIANDLLHFLRDRRPLGKGSVSDLFERIPSDWMLPPPQSGLWRSSVPDGQASANKVLD